ncbi:MAG: hypothetical protein V2A79_13450 [Planctomycetota bacterium]
MNRLAKVILCGVALAGVAAFAGDPENMVDNPLYKHWAQFKPGSYAKLKLVTEVVSNTTETLVTYTHKELTADLAVVEERTLVTVEGENVERKPVRKKYPAKITVQQAEKQDPPGDGQEGEEEIEVLGRKFKARWVETEIRRPQQVSSIKAWTSEEVPGQTLKLINRTSHPMEMKSESELVEFKADRN